MNWHTCPLHGEEECKAVIDPDALWYERAAFKHSCQVPFPNRYLHNFTKKGRPIGVRGRG